MELTPKAQAIELIKQSKDILILTHENPDGDALGSTLALYLVLSKIGKTPTPLVFGSINTKLDFLPSYDKLSKTLPVSRDLVININSEAVTDIKLGYKKVTENKTFRIVASPVGGALKPSDVTIENNSPKYDLIVMLDVATPERIGELYNEWPDLFYETPTVVIDHHATNSYFGKVNWVDLTATATSEMMVSLIEALGKEINLFDEDVATALLTGLITDTNSFQNPTTTPKSLTVGAQLVAAGARQQEIIQKLFKTKSLKTLKLWGRALSNITQEPSGYVWSYLSSQDLVDHHATLEDIGELNDELLKSAVGASFVMFMTERGGNTHASLRSIDNIDVSEIAGMFGGGGHRQAAAFNVVGDFATKKAEIITKISQFLLTKDKSTSQVS